MNAAIERLTGELPERALARKYSSEPVDVSDPWSFHIDTLLNFDPMYLDTLLNFDPMYRPRNLDQALEFLTVAVATKDRRIPDLLPTLERAEARVREVVAEGDERARVDAYTVGYSAGHHQSARSNLVRLSVLRGKSLAANDELDAAVASLTDVTKLTEELDEGSSELRALTAYELASAHARRAEVTADAADREHALERLRLAIDEGVVAHDIATWEDIKSEAFRVLAQDPGYQELIRGR